jgi:hypothetical protein
MEDKLLNLGERRVRLGFNPSLENKVDQIKLKTAELINLIHQERIALRGGLNYSLEEHLNAEDKNRLIGLAETKFEEAAMWAVKALTTNIK